MYYPLFSQYTFVIQVIFNLEIYDCTNTLWFEKKWGIKVQLLSIDWIPPFLIQLLLLLYHVTYLHYIIHFSNIKAFFSENNKNRAISLGFFINLLSEEQFLYTIEL